MTTLPTDPQDRWTVTKSMIFAAAKTAEALPAAERADIYEGIALTALAFQEIQEAREVGQSASKLADALRSSESLQLHFRNLCA